MKISFLYKSVSLKFSISVQNSMKFEIGNVVDTSPLLTRSNLKRINLLVHLPRTLQVQM